MLIAAGAITLALGEYVDTAVIFGVVVINAILGFVQESKAEAALDSLRSMVHTRARVIRGGHEQSIASGSPCRSSASSPLLIYPR